MRRILIAVNEPVLAAGLEAILKTGGFEIQEICADVAALFESIQTSRPDVAIIDGVIAGTMRMIRDLRSLAPQCQLLLWGGRVSDEQAAEAMRLGAVAVLPSNISPAHLIEAMDMLVTFPPLKSAPGASVKDLCDPNERRLIALVSAGMNDDEIAAILHHDKSTVNRLIKSVSHRLGAKDRYELVLYGLSSVNDVP